MKKLLLSLIALIGIGTSVFAADVTISDIEIPQGKTAKLSISLSNVDAGTPLYGYELYFTLPDGITVTAEEVGSLLSSTAYEVASNVKDGEYRAVMAPPMSNGSITSDGEILVLTLQADASLAAGSVIEGTIRSKSSYETSDNTADYDFADVTFKMTIVDYTTLDENATTAPEDATGVKVKVIRTINADEWSTICLHFAMTAEQVTAAFGSDVSVANFTGYDTEEDGDGNVTGITVNFENVAATTDGIEGNHPYLIKVSSAISEFSVDGVDIVVEDEPTVAAVKRTKKAWSEMIGTYVANTTIAEDMLFLNSNKFWYSAGLTTMKGYRAYFDFYDVLSEVENAVKLNVLVDGDATRIEGIQSNTEEATYDLSGRKLERPIHRGVYIQNGKKVLVK